MKKTKIDGGIRNNIQTVVATMAIMVAFGTAAHAHVRARPSFVNFGSESVGSTSASHTVTITNDNSYSVTISSVSDSVAQFPYSGPSLPFSLNPGQSLTGTVTFKPSAAQAYSGTLEFKRSTGSTIWVALRGTGIGQPTPIAPIAPTISSQPASAKITAGQTATFNLAATGTAPMTYQWKKNGAAIGGATSSTYSTPAETTTDNNAQFTAEVSNSAGSAASNVATLTVSASTLLLNSSSPSLTFGSVTVSSNSTQSVTLTNAGNSSVTISNVSVSGAGFNAGGVSSGLILAPGQAASLTATFTPSGAGIAKGSILVTSNATNSPDAISLSGTGLAVVNHSVALSWAPSTSTVVGYNTYSSPQSGGPYTKLTSAPVAVTSYTDSAVQPGQTYYFVVTSVNSSNEESACSAEVTALVP